MQDRDHVLDQINKLMAIAGDAGASDNEVEMAFERAQKLIRRHAVQEWELENRGERTVEPVTDLEVELHYGKFNRIACGLASKIGEMNSVKVLLTQGRRWREGGYRRVKGEVRYVPRRVVVHDKGMRLIGRKTDIDRMLVVWTSLELFRASHYRMRWNGSNVRYLTANEFRKSYYLGFNHAIEMRVDELLSSDEGVCSTAMVLAKEEAIDMYIREKIGSVQDSHSRGHKVYQAAFQSGCSDGANADIGNLKVDSSRTLIES